MLTFFFLCVCVLLSLHLPLQPIPPQAMSFPKTRLSAGTSEILVSVEERQPAGAVRWGVVWMGGRPLERKGISSRGVAQELSKPMMCVYIYTHMLVYKGMFLCSCPSLNVSACQSSQISSSEEIFSRAEMSVSARTQIRCDM